MNTYNFVIQKLTKATITRKKLYPVKFQKY